MKCINVNNDNSNNDIRREKKIIILIFNKNVRHIKSEEKRIQLFLLEKTEMRDKQDDVMYQHQLKHFF